MSKHMTSATSQVQGVPAAYSEGFTAFYQDEPVCKYRPRSYYNQEWHRGFNAAYFLNRTKHVQSISISRLQQV